MKRILVGVFLCFMIVPKYSNGGFFSFVHDLMYGKETAGRAVASSKGINSDVISPDPRAYSRTRQVAYGVAHSALTAFIAWGFGDFVTYGMGTGAGVIAGMVAVVGLFGNEVLPASLVTRVTNEKLPVADRITEGALTAGGTIITLIMCLPGETAIWSAQRTNDHFCLKSDTGRYGHAVIAGVLLAVQVGHQFAKAIMPSQRRITNHKGKMWVLAESIVERIPLLMAPIAFIYAKRGGDAFFGPQCVEKTRDSNPSILTNPVGFTSDLESTFPFGLASGGVAAMMILPWFGKAARETVGMVRYVFENRDPVVGTGLAVSMVTTSFFVDSLMGHIWKYALPNLSCSAFPVEGAATILGLTLGQATSTAPNLSPSLPYNLTVFSLEQLQASGGMQPIGLTPVVPTIAEIIGGKLPTTVGTPSSDLKVAVGFMLYPTALLSASFFAKGIANIVRALRWNRKLLDEYFGKNYVDEMRNLLPLGDTDKLDGIPSQVQDFETGQATTVNPLL